MLFGDGIANLVTGLGTMQDKAQHSFYAFDPFMFADLDNAFRTSTWLRKIIEIPVDDALSKGREWKADEALAEKLEEECDRLGYVQKVREAMKLGRKDGGALLFMGGLPGNPETPLDIEKVTAGSLKYITVLSRFDVTPGERDTNRLSPTFNEPMWYEVTGNAGQAKIHPSRVIRFGGNKVLSQYMGSWSSWDDPVYLTIRDAMLNSDATGKGIAHLVQEAKVDVISIPGLTSRMATAEYEGQLMRRITVSNMLKSLTNMLVIDASTGDGEPGETYETKQINFANLPEVQQTQLAILAGACDIPATRLLGKSPDGMNASGDGDLRNYYDKIMTHQKLDLTPLLRPLDEVLIRSALGSRPADLWYIWNPLYTLTETEAADVEKKFAETVKIYVDTGIIEEDVLASVAKNRMIESGQWPGMERAIAETAIEIDFEGRQERADNPPTPLQIAGPVQQKQLTTDAAPMTLYVRRDVTNASAIHNWAVSQGFTDIVDDLHVTIIYSKTPIDWMSVESSWSGAKLEIDAGGPRLIEQFDGGAIVLAISNRDLSWRNEEIRRAGASSDRDEYQAHITISKAPFAGDLTKVVPYQGKIVLGPEIWTRIKSDDLFSPVTL